MKKIIFVIFLSLLNFTTVSHSKIFYFNKCYYDFMKNFSEMNMSQNSYIVDIEKGTVINYQNRKQTNKLITNNYKIDNLNNNIIKAYNEEKDKFLINLKIYLTKKQVELEMFLYDTKTLEKTNVKYLLNCD
jgi:hypothetical protein